MPEIENYQMQVINEDTQEVEKILHPESDANIISYIDNEPVINGIGGITAGTTYPDGTVQQVLYDLLHPYVKPTVSISASPNGSVREKGDTSVANPTFTATVGKKSANISKVEFFVNNASAGTVEAPKANGGTETFQYMNSITANTTVYCNVTDAKNGTTKSNTITYTFVYPAFIGYLDASVSAPTEENIESLEKKIVSKSTQSYTYSIDNKRMCMACPPGWTLTKITDPNNFDVTGTFAKSTVSVTGLDGTPQQYTVYLSEPTSQTNFKVTFA